MDAIYAAFYCWWKVPIISLHSTFITWFLFPLISFLLWTAKLFLVLWFVYFHIRTLNSYMRFFPCTSQSKGSCLCFTSFRPIDWVVTFFVSLLFCCVVLCCFWWSSSCYILPLVCGVHLLTIPRSVKVGGYSAFSSQGSHSNFSRAFTLWWISCICSLECKCLYVSLLYICKIIKTIVLLFNH